MLKDIRLPEDRHYENGTQLEPIEFYLNALCNSTQWDLLLGYFSSAAINVLSLGFATFIHNGGILRLVINNVLSKEDREAIKLANTFDQDMPFDLSDIEKLKRSLDQYDRHFFECIAWLIGNNRIQIKIIAPKEGAGISHYKSGQFYDGTNAIYFHGSCNMTAYGLLKNLEEINITTSWDNSLSEKQITCHSNRFESIFKGEASHVRYLELDQTITAIKDQFGDKEINELIIQEQELISLKKNIFENNSRVLKVISKVNNIISKKAIEPRFPFTKGARPYQIQAYANWCKNNYKGLFAMATGTGKTITSLNCLLEEYKKVNAYRAIIVVPTVALVNQWKKECEKFNFRKTYLINSKTKWNNDVSALKTEYLINKMVSFILIVTYASFVKQKFQSILRGLPSDTLFIADEAHYLGSKNVSNTLINFELQKRIGLSATPDRKYDDVGNAIINKFFNSLSSYTFTYSMEEAIKNGVLCQYRYYPHIVYLTSEEQEEYNAISKALAKLFNSESEGSFFDNPLVQMKLLERKRIIHKAKNKLAVFKRILEEEFVCRGNLKYTLVYVPEGNLNSDNDEEFGDIYQNTDIFEEEDDDERIIDVYTRTVRDIDERIIVGQYTSRTYNRELLLKQFEIGEMDVLTSMKCLDEGVDIPRAELAIFCASTGNPRQFVQRRGRVLRNHEDKSRATIHDLVVVPITNIESETYEVEKNMLRKELERVINFSSLSSNKMDTYFELKDIIDHYRLNLYEQ